MRVRVPPMQFLSAPGGDMASDGVVELQKATQALSIAYNAWQGSSFCKVFAVKQDLAGLTREQTIQRQALLRLLGGLVEGEFEAQMDALTAAWISYREATANVPG